MKLEDIELSEEQRLAAVELTPEQLEFARLWLDRHNNGLTSWQCVAKAYKGHDESNVTSCSATAARLINHDDKVRRFIHAMNKQALRMATYDTASLVKNLQRQAKSTEQKLDGIVEWRWDKDSRGKPVRHAWVPDMSVITGEALECVTGYTECPDGGMYLIYREICDEKTRQRAAELLGKMAGEFVERVEHSGRIDSVNANITADDPVKAASDYSALIKGVDGGSAKR